MIVVTDEICDLGFDVAALPRERFSPMARSSQLCAASDGLERPEQQTRRARLLLVRTYPLTAAAGAAPRAKVLGSEANPCPSTHMSRADEQMIAPASVTLWFGFGAMCFGMFMAVLDIQIVLTSLPVIEAALKIGADLMSWVQTAYLIAEVIAIPLTGLLIRIYSLKYVSAIAIIGFTVSSIGCALSNGFASLILMRVLQGFSGGLLIPMVFSAIFTIFRPGLEQTVATTMAGVLAVLAPAFGPIAGGYITQSLSWHWLFLVNVVPGVASLIVGLICHDKGGLRNSRRIETVLADLRMSLTARDAAHHVNHPRPATTVLATRKSVVGQKIAPKRLQLFDLPRQTTRQVIEVRLSLVALTEQPLDL